MPFQNFPPSPLELMGKYHVTMEKIFLAQPLDFMIFGESSVKWKQIVLNPLFEDMCLAYLNKEFDWGDILRLNADMCLLIEEQHDETMLLCLLVMSAIIADEECQKYVLSWTEFQNSPQGLRPVVHMARYCLEKMTCPSRSRTTLV